MNKYLLDTNTVSFAFDGGSPHRRNVVSRFRALDDSDVVYVSILTLYELNYSLSKLPADMPATYIRISNTISSLSGQFVQLQLSPVGAGIFGRMKAAYQHHFGINRSTMKHYTIDIMIASKAVEHNAVLVSNDSFFSKLNKAFPALLIDDWTK